MSLSVKLSDKLTLFMKWFLAYIAVVGISTSYIYYVHNVYSHRIEELQKLRTEAYIGQLGEIMDSDLASLRTSTSLINSDFSVNYSFNSSRYGDLTGDPFMRSLSLRSIGVYNLSNPLISNVHVYSSRAKAVITSSAIYEAESLDVYARSYFNSSGFSFEALIGESSQPRFCRMDDLTGIDIFGNRLLFLDPIPVNSTNPRGVVIYELGLDRIREILDYREDEYLGRFFLLNEERTVLYSSADESVPDFAGLSPGVSGKLDWDGTTYDINSRGLFNGKLILVYAEDSRLREITIGQSRREALYSVLVFGTIGLIVGYLVSYRITRRLKGISENLPVSASSGGDEISAIEDFMRWNRNHEEELERELRSKQTALRDYVLGRWLTGYYLREDELCEALDSVGVEPPEGEVLLAAFKVNHVLSNSQGEGIDLEGLKKYLESLIGGKLKRVARYETLVRENLLFVLVFPLDPESWPVPQFADRMQDIIKECQKDHGLDINGAVSRIHSSSVSVPAAYGEVLEAFVYNDMTGQADLIEHIEIPRIHKHYAYSHEDEQKLINLIKTGNQEAAIELANRILDDNWSKDAVDLDMLHCLFYDLTGTVLKSIDEPRELKLIKKENPFRRLKNETDLVRMREIVLAAIDAVTVDNFSRRSSEGGRQITEEIKEFVESNYMQPDLNVNNIGFAFKLSPSYISKLFKDREGESILGYLNRKRTESAKKLLSTTDSPVSKIAESVGFNYSNVFIRIFKKSTGLTPGQYRELHGKG